MPAEEATVAGGGVVAAAAAAVVDGGGRIGAWQPSAKSKTRRVTGRRWRESRVPKTY